MPDTEAFESDIKLAEAIQSAAGARLQDVRVVHHGSHFLLARAYHRGSDALALLTISRLGHREALKQLLNIRTCLQLAGSSDLGFVLDRVWDEAPDPTAKHGIRPAAEWGCLVTSWHADAIGLDEAILGVNGSYRIRNFLRFIRTLAAQLEALHAGGFAHGDISPSNVLVSPDGRPHLVDFEYLTGGRGSDNPRIVFSDSAFETPGYSHPDRLGLIESSSYTLGDLQRWDVFAFGKLILSSLADADPYAYEDLTTYAQRALRTIACMMLDGRNEPAEVSLGLPVRFFAEEKLSTIHDVVAALDRIANDAALESAVPELRWLPEKVVEVGTLSPAAFTQRVHAVVNTSEMQQLSGMLQLGLVSFVWPGATHTRLEHALGTYSLACAAVSNLFADPQSPLFRVLATPKIVRTLLVTALLHDVGHYPLAHDVEEAYAKAFKHEDRSITIVTATNSPIRSLLVGTGEDGWDVEPDDVASVIAGKHHGQSSMSEFTRGLLHSIISGTLDVDKLDYLVRDSRALSVKAGEGIDVRRILGALTILFVDETEAPLRLGIRSKGVRPAELVGRIRSHMFGVVYWHHSYRAIKAMMHWIVWEAVNARGTDLRAGTITAKELFAELEPGKMLSAAGDALTGVSLPPREGAVLEFFWGKSKSVSSREVLRLLGEKRWYKSVLNIEHYSNTTSVPFSAEREREIWSALDALPVAPAKHAVARVALAKSIQERIVQWFQLRTEGETGTLIRGWADAKTRFLVTATKQQLFLLDLSDTRKATDKHLFFVAAERLNSRSIDPASPLTIRRSYDQQRLAEEFVASNAVIRLFCHPNFDSFVSQSIPDESLYNIVHEELLRATRDVAVTQSES